MNRPRVLNAFNVQMRDDLFQVLEAIREDPDVGVVLVTGEGRSFCAGADLTEFGTAPSQAVAREVRWERDVWGAFLSIRQPLIAAIHGYCMGSGMEIAMLCDFRIASEDAVFGMPEVALGMIPAAGGTQTLSRTVGIPGALDLLLTARRVDATEALRLGLVGKVVAKVDLLTEAEAMASNLLELDPKVVQATKQAVRHGSEMGLEAGLVLEARLASAAMATSDGELAG